jgi:hypothetical protein
MSFDEVNAKPETILGVSRADLIVICGSLVTQKPNEVTEICQKWAKTASCPVLCMRVLF